MEDNKKKLILGDGLLGSCIHNLTGWDYISRKKNGIDFSDIETYCSFLDKYDEIINCIAHTDTYSKDREIHWNVNYKAVVDLVDYCAKNEKKTIHISTDFVYSNSVPDASEEDVPVHCQNWYGYTKLLSDAYVQLKGKKYLVLRTAQKKRPFTYEYAYINQVGNFDYVDKIAELVVELIEENAVGVYNVGTKKKTMFYLASQTKDDVKPTTDLFDPSTPPDVSMDISKLVI